MRLVRSAVIWPENRPQQPRKPSESDWPSNSNVPLTKMGSEQLGWLFPLRFWPSIVVWKLTLSAPEARSLARESRIRLKPKLNVKLRINWNGIGVLIFPLQFNLAERLA